MNRIYRVGIGFLITTLLCACVTTKKKGDVPWLKRNYHSLTTKYNYFYNANILLQEGIAKLNQQHSDNYNQILAMYPYSDMENVESVTADMDKAIQKMSTAASIHKYGDWVGDCALLMAKAQYVKRDYESAEETLIYLTEEFKPNAKRKSVRDKKREAEIKKALAKKKIKEKKKLAEERKKQAEQRKKANERKRKEAAKNKKSSGKSKKPTAKTEPAPVVVPEVKKEKIKKEEAKLAFEPKDEGQEKPKSYFLRHRPAYQEGMAWLGRTLTERQKYSEAEEVLISLLKQKSTFRSVRRLAAQFYAYNFLKQKEYAKAVQPLERAIELTVNRREKARFYFILGQIQEKLMRDAEALAAYEKVLDYKSIPYDMEFSARMNVALFAYTKGQGSAENALKSLQKMARESKNEDYLDQIYFAMAQIALKNNDRKLAIENLQKSLRFSKKNPAQKGESYLLMAQLYYSSENFVAAKNYYDSTITVLPKSDDRYDEAKRLAIGLTEISKNLKIIQAKDSLLRIASMSPEDQKAFCLTLKQKEIESQEKAEAAAAAAATAKNAAADFNIVYGPGVTPSTFFAYNPKGLAQGARQFQQKWGKNRKLEDDWRRSGKKNSNTGDNVTDAGKDQQQKSRRDRSSISEEEFGKMMTAVPQNPKDIDAMNNDVAIAYYGLGRAFREAIQRNDKCIVTLEELLKRFPDTPKELEALYYLYGAYSDTGNTAKAKECYDKIVSKYPNTTYARILTDPDFAKKSKKEGQEIEDYYTSTYTAFKKAQYQIALDRCRQADTLFKAKNPYKAKFALLAAMSTGYVAGKEKYILAIKEVIAKFPETPEQKRAKEILRLLDGGEAAYNEISGTDPGKTGAYKREDESVHYIVVILNDKDAKIEDIKTKISDFNQDNYKVKNLRVANVFFGTDSDIPMLVVRKFEERNDAMKYYDHLQKVRSSVMPDKVSFNIYAISQNNYKELLKDKNAAVYNAFFDFVYKQK